MRKKFLLLLSLITIAGFLLRFYQYDRVPGYGELFDEQHYAFGGVTWLKTGTPKSWSWFDSFPHVERVLKGGIEWDIKSPMIEKPPLYFLLSGITVILSGSKELYETELYAIRILPLLLSIATIFLTGILAREMFSEKIGLLASALYAITPTIVLSNRLSVTENLLTPLTLLAVYIIVRKKQAGWAVSIVGVLATLAILTKQTGLAVALTAITAYFFLKRFSDVVIIAVFALLGVFIIFAFAAHYDWPLFLRLQTEIQAQHALQGLPESFINIFQRPTISQKNHFFPDGTILLGLLFLFTAPWWLSYQAAEDKLEEQKKTVFLAFPFWYTLLFVLSESGSTPYTFWGWYVFPLFPFLIILLAKVFSETWKHTNLFQLTLLLVGLVPVSIRFLLLQFPAYQPFWQIILSLIALPVLTITASKRPRLIKATLLLLFVCFVGVNLYTAIHLQTIYPKSILDH